MRCARCSSYIPEGFSEQNQCPQCGAAPEKIESVAQEVKESFVDTSENLVEVRSAKPFASFFTILLFAAVTRNETDAAAMSSVSLSFGVEGFSLVSQGGRAWEKFRYRDLVQITNVQSDAVRIEFRDQPSLTLKVTRSKQPVLRELLDRVQNGLNDFEISLYKRKLE